MNYKGFYRHSSPFFRRKFVGVKTRTFKITCLKPIFYEIECVMHPRCFNNLFCSWVLVFSWDFIRWFLFSYVHVLYYSFSILFLNVFVNSFHLLWLSCLLDLWSCFIFSVVFFYPPIPENTSFQSISFLIVLIWYIRHSLSQNLGFKFWLDIK